MSVLKNFARGIASLFHRQRVEHELDEELQGFLEASLAHKERNGMTRTGSAASGRRGDGQQ